MIERSAFLEGFTERLQNVLQKHEREREAFSNLVATRASIASSRADDSYSSIALSRAERMTTAAIDELARYLCDAFDGVSSSGVSPRPTIAGLAKAPEPSA